MNKRRKLVIALGAGALAALPAGFACAQPAQRTGKTLRVGIIILARRADPHTNMKLFVDTLREFGWVEGRNIA